MGDHEDVTSRFIPGEFGPEELVCLRCERVVELFVGNSAGLP